MRQGLYEKAKQGLTSTIDPTAEAGENILIHQKEPKKLLVSGAVIIGTLMVGKWLLEKERLKG
jgi:methylthioribose-1-phosphate isomerase